MIIGKVFSSVILTRDEGSTIICATQAKGKEKDKVCLKDIDRYEQNACFLVPDYTAATVTEKLLFDNSQHQMLGYL